MVVQTTDNHVTNHRMAFICGFATTEEAQAYIDNLTLKHPRQFSCVIMTDEQAGLISKPIRQLSESWHNRVIQSKPGLPLIVNSRGK